MRSLSRCCLVLALCIAPALAQQPAETMPRLTNKEVIELVTAGLSPEIIVAKIKVSRCNFDTTPSVLAELKRGGMPDGVLMAMVEAPYGVPKIAPAPQPEPKPAPEPDRAGARAATNQPREISDALPTYGDASELRGLRKVYITADEPTSRDWIRGVFNKYEGLSVVNSPEEAEFFIECGVKSSTESRGRQRSHYLRQQMTAFTLDESGRKRILWYENETYEESRGFSFSRPNEVNMAMHFVSMMKKLQGGQKYKGQGRSAAP